MGVIDLRSDGRVAGITDIRVALAVLLLVLVGAALYRNVLPLWVADLWVDDNYSHGIIVPFVSAWLAYDRRDDLARLVPQPSLVGLAIVLGGVGLLLVGRLAAELFTMRLSLVVVIVGVIVSVLGWGYARILALPLGFLLFMVPLPAVVLNSVTLPLQFAASEIAVTALHWLRLPALREGNIILLPNTSLEVVEACSGLRSLISLGAMGVVVAVLFLRGTGPRVLLAALSVPIAVLMNGARVAGTGVLSYYYGSEVAEGFFHTFSGWLVFVAALALLAAAAMVVRPLDRTSG
ncbi:exosortase [Candidatus Binatia bacterium]|nr:exosortase [Candidatus Binatia bacterium]